MKKNEVKEAKVKESKKEAKETKAPKEKKERRKLGLPGKIIIGLVTIVIGLGAWVISLITGRAKDPAEVKETVDAAVQTVTDVVTGGTDA